MRCWENLGDLPLVIEMFVSFRSFRCAPLAKRLIGSYIRSWERPDDLPRVVEMLCLFASGAQRNDPKDTTISFFRISRCPFPYI
jgi:hypothetical protein